MSIKSFATCAMIFATLLSASLYAAAQTTEEIVVRAKSCIQFQDFDCAQRELQLAWQLAKTVNEQTLVKDTLVDLELAKLEEYDAEARAESASARQAFQQNQNQTVVEIRESKRREDRQDQMERVNKQKAQETQQQSSTQAALIEIQRQLTDRAQQNERINEEIQRLVTEAKQQKQTQADNAAARQNDAGTVGAQVSPQHQNSHRAHDAEIVAQKNIEAERLAKMESERRAELAREQRAEAERLANVEREKQAEIAQQQKAEAERLAALPRLGGPPNKSGCWIPRRDQPWCVAVTKAVMMKSAEVRVTFRNDCAWGTYVSYGIERRDGSWDSGASHLRAGASMSWQGQGNGSYRYNFTGSDLASADWVCSAHDVDPGFEITRTGQALLE